ncbi:MAG: hypothetical protein Ct9H300mP19_20930 [Dehalococcoidia bacterium]|nr:MAG: hypothetical protein Ct9H300mP19_20930 [Dehalococcoidia bacterium]
MANKLLKDHDKEFEAIAGFLLEHETIDFDQFVAIIDGKDPLLASPMATETPNSSDDPPMPQMKRERSTDTQIRSLKSLRADEN